MDTVNRIGKVEEVFIVINLPLTLNPAQVKKWIEDSVSPFVKEFLDITPSSLGQA